MVKKGSSGKSTIFCFHTWNFIQVKPGVSNLNEVWATAGTVISSEGHFSIQVVQKKTNKPNFKGQIALYFFMSIHGPQVGVTWAASGPLGRKFETPGLNKQIYLSVGYS